jgi:hypothetical protein
MNLYKLTRDGKDMGQCHADDEEDAIWIMMTRRGYPMNYVERAKWQAEEADHD